MSEIEYVKRPFSCLQRRFAFFSAWVLVTALTSACAGTQKTAKTGYPEKPAIKMRHQILFRFGEEAHVFEGYMIHRDEAFYVKAFAGPGVDLFTLVRDGAWHREELHIPGLKDKIDLHLVSESIAKVYLGGCVPVSGPGETACDFYGERMVETYRSGGGLVRREFLSESQGALTIRYRESDSCGGYLVPKRIELTWGEGDVSMVIRLVACDLLSRVEPGLWDR